ncbi:MAG: hypothetical protein Q9225_000434 [Loekoesia sp. 1 TL-2023]
MPSFKDVYMMAALQGCRNPKVNGVDPKVSHLDYHWGDFETEEDLAEAELYEYTSGSRQTNEYSSPFRDPESPLDEQDLERFEVRTAQLASCTDDCSCHDADLDLGFVPRTPDIKPMDMSTEHEEEPAFHDNLPPAMLTLANQQELLAAVERLERRVAFLETSMEQNHNSLEQEVLDASEKLSNGIGIIIELLVSGSHQGNSGHLRKTQNSAYGANAHTPNDIKSFPNHRATGTIPENQAASSQPPKSKLSLTEKYTQAWHSGGLILIEHLSEQTPARDIQALFQQFGRITYLELHGADKSRPHIPTRHAYIHYAEYSSALEARRNLHGFPFQNRNLMVFVLSTAVVRGEPGKPYRGSALEILNFNGGSNYAAPGADCFQTENEGLRQLNGEVALMTVSGADCLQVEDLAQKHAVDTSATYSLTPTLTAKTAAASWRRMDVPGAMHGEFVHEDLDEEEIVFKGRDIRNHPIVLDTVDEYDEEEGGVRLDPEEGGDDEDGRVYLPYEYEPADEDEDLEFCVPVQPREFL